MRVALDAMGGDFAPGPIVAGACEAVGDLPELTVVLVGDRERIEAELAKAPTAPRDRLLIVHASQAIGMDEKPVEALRKKRDSSISRCWGMMAGGEVEGLRHQRVHTIHVGAPLEAGGQSGERPVVDAPVIGPAEHPAIKPRSLGHESDPALGDEPAQTDECRPHKPRSEVERADQRHGVPNQQRGHIVDEERG